MHIDRYHIIVPLTIRAILIYVHNIEVNMNWGKCNALFAVIGLVDDDATLH